MESGRCPHCHRDGPAGEPCASPGCALRRYHYVPASFVPELSKLGGDDDDPLLGRVVADFLVVGVVGSGGFGNVHHVLQLPLRARPVQGALKRLKLSRPPGDDDRDYQTVLQRFAAEADALASLSHPHIVRLLKAGLDGDTPYLVLELVTDADTLERELDDHARHGETLPDTELLSVADQTLSALEAAHALNIVHRDVKPGNIMLQRVAGYDVFVRVLDFGLAKFIGESSETQRVMGTLDYMAPEQLRGRDIGPWTDLYALGLVILAMTTGRPSFSADRAVLINQKLDPHFDPVAEALSGRDIDAARAAFLRKATAYDRHQRYPNVAELRRALHDAFKPVTRRRAVRTRDLSGAAQAALGQQVQPVTPLPSRRPPSQATAIIKDESRPRLVVAPAPARDESPPAALVRGTPREESAPRPLPAAAEPPRTPAPQSRPPSVPLAPPPEASPSEGGGGRWPLLAAVDRSRFQRPHTVAPVSYDRPEPRTPRMGLDPAPGGTRAPPIAPTPGAHITAKHGGTGLRRGIFDTVDAQEGADDETPPT